LEEEVMNSVVIYSSHFGNTRKVAEAIADGLRTHGQALMFDTEDAPTRLLEEADLVVIGGPTEQHKMTEPLARFLNRLARAAPAAVAIVDTRLRWPRWLSGSAAVSVASRLRQAGAHLVVPEESFFVKGAAGTSGRDTAELEDGELERAGVWAIALAERVEFAQPATPGAGS
jgi:flavodoxin